MITTILVLAAIVWGLNELGAFDASAWEADTRTEAEIKYDRIAAPLHNMPGETRESRERNAKIKLDRALAKYKREDQEEGEEVIWARRARWGLK